jgi:hypothetical protein
MVEFKRLFEQERYHDILEKAKLLDQCPDLDIRGKEFMDLVKEHEDFLYEECFEESNG